MTHDNGLPRYFDPYYEGRVVPLDADAVEVAAHALAVDDGDSRAYDTDPEFRESCASTARLVIGIYLTRQSVSRPTS